MFFRKNELRRSLRPCHMACNCLTSQPYLGKVQDNYRVAGNPSCDQVESYSLLQAKRSCLTGLMNIIWPVCQTRLFDCLISRQVRLRLVLVTRKLLDLAPFNIIYDQMVKVSY